MSGRRLPRVRLALCVMGLAACSTSTTSVRAVPATAPAVPTPTRGNGTESPAATVSPVSAADLGASWHDGCPLAPDQLRVVKVGYWGFDDQAHEGSLVVNVAATESAIKVFGRLYDDHFPLRRVEPVDAFGGDDNASMAADNTSGFNCRAAVAPGPPRWSAHAYGQAIDVNPVENPYVQGGDVLPPDGAPYVERSNVRPGMAVPGGPLTAAFATAGWSWGGDWSSPDYQHFSSTGG